MSRTVRRLSLATAALLLVPSLSGRAHASSDPAASADTPFITPNPTIQASLARISRGSVLWREAVDAVRTTGRRALVVASTDDLRLPGNEGYVPAMEQPGLAEVIPVVRTDAKIALVVVVVNLKLIQDLHDADFSVPRDFEADLDRILVHEVYGHAVPYLLRGDLSGRCADPVRGESATDACSIIRENAVRAELGLGRRTDHGLRSLTLARGRRF